MFSFDEIVQRSRAEMSGVAELESLRFDCQSCGQPHQGLSDHSHSAPTPYQSADEAEWEHFQISSDFCRNNATGDCFVRGVLPLPIIGTEASFNYGAWSSLSQEDFQTYVETFDQDQGGLGPWFGWFSSALNGYPKTLALKVKVHPQPNGKRPIFELEPTDHPLALEQYQGISVERVLEIYAANGHGPGAAAATE